MDKKLQIEGPLSQPALLAGLVEYQNQAIMSKTIFSRPGGNVTVFAFDAGQGLSEHTAPFDAMVTVVDGEGEIVIQGQSHRVKTGEAILMPAGKPHAVEARDRLKMLLLMIKS
ncbi:MAG TPA: cupin domain-containing protein [Syntrophomonadaceae bacterium]|nr:cupin domain-containing protein [Syntrophomonadaceae bacterium]